MAANICFASAAALASAFVASTFASERVFVALALAAARISIAFASALALMSFAPAGPRASKTALRSFGVLATSTPVAVPMAMLIGSIDLIPPIISSARLARRLVAEVFASEHLHQRD